MTIQIQCQRCLHWVTHHVMMVDLRSIFGKEIELRCSLCRREIKFAILR